MAGYGLKWPRFAPNKTVAEDGTITYDTPVTIGEAVKADLTISKAAGKIYGNNALSEATSDFISGTIAMETVDLTDDVASVIFGATVKENTCVYNVNDNPPEGALAYLKTLLRKGKTVYKPYFFPRAKAEMGNDTAATKGESVTFSTAATTWTIMAPASGNWFETTECDTEEEARAWIDEMMGVPKVGV